LTNVRRLALVVIFALAGVVGQHRALGLLGLQQQRVKAVSGSISKIHVSVPTLPTPTTLRATRVRVKTSRRSGEAKAPKFSRCASPHNCARSPEDLAPARSAAIGSAAPR
jgi:hypothetical protein